MKNYYFSFNNYLRDKFGQRIQRISLDPGFGCPNLDGSIDSAGCIYCNNRAFAPYAQSSKPLPQQILESMDFYKKRFKVNKFIAYFQAFSATYADAESLKKCYDVIKDFPEIVGIFVSTRPDCIDKEKIKVIADYKNNYLTWIEYGLQTTDDKVLKSINRNHSYQDFIKAYELTSSYNINIGIHMILGLPGTSRDSVIKDAGRISQLNIQGVKFHVLHVLKNTQLEKLYKNNEIKLLNKDEYVSLVCDFLERIPPEMVILRLVSTAGPKHLVAPSWINQKTLLIERVKKELIKRNTHQGVLYESTGVKGKKS